MKNHDKSEKIERFLEVLLRLIERYGVDGYKISDLAKKAKVSRPWIYKMFGGQKKTLAREAALYFGKHFSELAHIEASPESKEDLIESFQRGSEQLIQDSVRYPHIVNLYFRHMGLSDPIGQVIKEIEVSYLKKLITTIIQALKEDEKKAEQQAKLLLVARMGLIYSWLKNSKAPKVDDLEIRRDLIYSVERILN